MSVKHVSKCCVLLKLGKELTARMQHSIDLVGVSGIKPRINDIMPIICSRLEEEHRKEMLETAKRWRRESHDYWDNMIYDCMGEDDYILPDDEYALSGVGSKKRLKRLNKKYFKEGNKGTKKRSKVKYSSYSDDEDDYWNNRHSMYTHGEWNDEDEDDYESPYKSIKFYPDIENEMVYEEFHSLKEFDDYCTEHGISVGDVDYSNLRDWSVVHCCLDPIDEEYGEKAIITDSSYGGLYWTVSDDLTKKAVNNDDGQSNYSSDIY